MQMRKLRPEGKSVVFTLPVMECGFEPGSFYSSLPGMTSSFSATAAGTDLAKTALLSGCV